MAQYIPPVERIDKVGKLYGMGFITKAQAQEFLGLPVQEIEPPL